MNTQPVHAQEPEFADAQLLLSPPNLDRPTEVEVDIGIAEVFDIDARAESYVVDAYLDLSWMDERLVFDPAEFGTDRKVYQDDTALGILATKIWWPSVGIVNARQVRERMHVSVVVHHDGKVTYRERFTALIAQRFNLTKFPFDQHTVYFRIEPFEYTAEHVVFTPPDDLFNYHWDTEEWEVTPAPLTVAIELSNSPEATEDNVKYSTATASIIIERIPSFYIVSFLIPLFLIVSISWVVFWMDYDTMHLADRMSVSFTSVLTVVAFDFISTDSLPKLAYPTFLDNVLSLSYIFLVFVIIENVIGYNLQRADRIDTAHNVDVRSRWLFPVGYYVTILIIFVATMSL